jgi:hypothetical protein
MGGSRRPKRVQIIATLKERDQATARTSLRQGRQFGGYPPIVLGLELETGEWIRPMRIETG